VGRGKRLADVWGVGQIVTGFGRSERSRLVLVAVRVEGRVGEWPARRPKFGYRLGATEESCSPCANSGFHAIRLIASP
jgi:hypothetical protein